VLADGHDGQFPAMLAARPRGLDNRDVEDLLEQPLRLSEPDDAYVSLDYAEETSDEADALVIAEASRPSPGQVPALPSRRALDLRHPSPRGRPDASRAAASHETRRRPRFRELQSRPWQANSCQQGACSDWWSLLIGGFVRPAS
jgi:hypothetical protein